MVFLDIFARTIGLILQLVSFSMLLRMILPFIFNPEESRLYALAYCISEPFIAPVRFVMVKMNVGQNSPIDWSFFVTYILIWVIEGLLPIV